MNNSNSKYLINCQFGQNNPEQATISMILAFTASKTNDTAMFVTADGADFCIKGGAEAIRAEGYEPLDELLAGYLANGGKIWLCPACAKARGVSDEDLIMGVEIAGAPRTMAYLAEGGQVLA